MKKVFAVVLTALAIFQHGVSAQAARTSATWNVQKYDLDVSLPQDKGRAVTVKAVLSLKNVSSRPATTLTLRIAQSAEVSAVKINDATVDFAKSEEKVNVGLSLQRIAMRFSPVGPGTSLTATVDYKISVKDNSGMMSVGPNAAHFLPLAYWYPTPNSWYFTQGPDRAAFRLKVNAGGLAVVSSGAESASAFDEKLFGQPFFVAGSWDVSEQNGVWVSVPKGTVGDGLKRASEMAAIFSEAKTFMAGVFGSSPEVPLRIVASRRGAGFSGGGTVVVDEAVFRRSKVDSLTAMNIVEAAARIWLGNSISVAGDGYGVVTEGLARYLATQFLEAKFGKDVADIERLRQRNSYAAVSKRDAPMATVSPIDDYYYPAVANKGAMAWRILARRVGTAEFAKALRSSVEDGATNLAELRSGFAAQKPLIDHLFDQVTDTNLLVGLPVTSGAEMKVALRNTGSADVTVDIAATIESGEKVTASTTIRATSFGEVAFKSTGKIVRVEIDADKLYPQLDYSDDVQPRETTDSDPLLAAKRHFDKQEYAKAESTARTVLRDLPRFDDLRVLLGRSLLGQNKNVEAEREFKAVLEEKLPNARSLAWANVGLAEIASRSSQNDAAQRYANAAITVDADYGANLAARTLRNRLGYSSGVDASVREFFAAFDKAASSNRKADVDALVLPGEISKFAGGVSGSTETWQTEIKQIDRVDANTVLVEANMNVKLLNKEPETGIAVYRLVRSGNSWKLSAVDMFEVR
ncbi:MAG: hypothetical protein AB7J13_11460 [Pyrinomonadaceae bacterium]